MIAWHLGYYTAEENPPKTSGRRSPAEGCETNLLIVSVGSQSTSERKEREDGDRERERRKRTEIEREKMKNKDSMSQMPHRNLVHLHLTTLEFL